MSTPSAHLLASLFSPAAADEFLRTKWPDTAYSVHGDPGRLPPFLRNERLCDFKRLAACYHGKISFGNAATGSGTALAHDVPATLLRQMGLSLYLPDIADYVPGSAEFLRAVEQALGAQAYSARLGAFAAAAHNGVTSHYDAEEVISVQLQGEKRFYIAPMREISFPYGQQFGPDYEGFDELYPQMNAGIPTVNDSDFECVDMRPGSVLFMPRGTWHRTEATQDSLSLSIIIRQPAAFEGVLAQLKLALLRDPAWRRPLYGAGTTGTQAHAHVAALLAELPRVSLDLVPEAVLAAAGSEARATAALHETSWLQRVPHAHLRVSPGPESPGKHSGAVSLRGHDGSEREVVRLQIPAGMRPVFDYLAGQERPLRADTLGARFPSLPDAQLGTILDLLTRAGFFVVLPYPPLPADPAPATASGA